MLVAKLITIREETSERFEREVELTPGLKINTFAVDEIEIVRVDRTQWREHE